MKWFNNLRISFRLILSFICIAIIVVVVGMTGLSYIMKMKELDNNLYKKHMTAMPYLTSVARTYERENVSLRMMYMDKRPVMFEVYKDLINQTRETMEKSMEQYGKLVEDAHMKAMYNHLVQSLKAFHELRDDAIDAMESGDKDKAYDILNDQSMIDVTMEVVGYTDELIASESRLAKQSANDNTAAANSGRNIIIVVMVGSMIAALGLGLYVSRGIIKPINLLKADAERAALGEVNIASAINTRDEIGDLAVALGKMLEGIRNQVLAIEKIAEGDLTSDVEIRSDFDLMGKKLNELVQKNNEVMSNVISAADQVTSGAKQLSNASITLSEGAGEQASAVEQLTASLEEISSQTDLNAKNANEANALAINAKSKAEQGNGQMKEMLKAMEEISESSSNISRIIKVIDDIAFQTNILALNAAVEAARAGHHGKGFAVVAEEVRNLAARSASAAKETTDMIENSIKKSEDGRRIANTTAKSLNEIVDGVENVAVLVYDIAMASSEQASSIGQVNQGIMQVSQVTQTNSATAQESASASEELANQAEVLNEQVAMFKIKNTKRVEKRQSGVHMDNFSSHVASNDVKPKIVLSGNDFGKY